MEYICATKKIAVAALKALPTSKNLQKDLLSDPDALIAEVIQCTCIIGHEQMLQHSNVRLFL